jgi:hypothetical protein
MDEKKYSIREVLEITIRNLSDITIPVSMAEGLGMALVQNIRNLQMCIEAIDGNKETPPEVINEEPLQTEE